MPPWTKDLYGASKLINARAETVKEKPSFRSAFKKRRCLIIADGFYEWKKEKRQKQPFYITLPSGEPFAFAGLWEAWKKEDGSLYHSCTIITTEASESIQDIHNRMPVILKPEVISDWLNPEMQDTDKLEKILQEGICQELRSHPVSVYVNSPTNNDPTCIEPINKESF